MKRQNEMVESFLTGHRQFMTSLDTSIDLIEHDLQEAVDFDFECTGDRCTAMEASIDEMAKFIYALSEPRWLSAKDSKVIRDMRHRIHDFYATYKGLSPRSGRA